MLDRRISCPVLHEDLPVRKAEMFRIVKEIGGAFFLDFLNVCPYTAKILVVLRLRMQREALAAVRDRLAHDVIEFNSGMVH